MVTDYDLIHRDLPAQGRVDGLHLLPALEPPGHVRLVGHHDQQEPRPAQAPAGLEDARQDFQFLAIGGRMGFAIRLKVRAVEHPVPVEKYGSLHL
jgi:hypothetical protein